MLSKTLCVRMVSKYFSKTHEYIFIDGNVGTVGISTKASKDLGDIVFVELPEVDTEVAKEDYFGAVESVKAASDIYAPMSGKIIEVNEVLEDEPGLLGEDAEGEGWIAKIEIADMSEKDDLMDEESYRHFCETEEH